MWDVDGISAVQGQCSQRLSAMASAAQYICFSDFFCWIAAPGCPLTAMGPHAITIAARVDAVPWKAFPSSLLVFFCIPL
jgi:hypothetical protein